MNDWQLNQIRMEEQQWEISCFDVASNEIYKQWIKRQNNACEALEGDKIKQVVDSPNHMIFAFTRPPRKVLDAILYSMGLDVELGYERQLCLHRSWAGITGQGERYVGKQRIDSEWKEKMRKLKGIN